MPDPAYIYGLYDADGCLRYIGKANDPDKRLKSHMRSSRRLNTPLYAWIRKHGLPEMRVLENALDWREAERRLVADARSRGERLLNLADGGDEPFCSTETRRANGLNQIARMTGKASYPPHKLTWYSVVRDAHTWVLERAIEYRRRELAERVTVRMREQAATNPLYFHDWAEIRIA